MRDQTPKPVRHAPQEGPPVHDTRVPHASTLQLGTERPSAMQSSSRRLAMEEGGEGRGRLLNGDGREIPWAECGLNCGAKALPEKPCAGRRLPVGRARYPSEGSRPLPAQAVQEAAAQAVGAPGLPLPRLPPQGIKKQCRGSVQGLRPQSGKRRGPPREGARRSLPEQVREHPHVGLRPAPLLH